MELNAEQIKKALECCVKSECNKCPLRDGRCANGEMGRLALTIIKSQEQKIKELTEDVERVRKQCGEIIVECDERDAERLKQVAELIEENERLRADVAKEFTCVFGTSHKVSDCPIDDEVAKAKADTVRKMQERLKAEMRNTAKYSFGGREYSVIGEAFIDQIAKEMLEGDQ